MNYLKQRSKLIDLEYEKNQDRINIYKQIIEKKFIKRPFDFFEGEEFFKESKQIQQVLEVELNSLIIDISVLELKNMAQKFRDIYKLLTIVLNHVTQRTIYFYTKFKKQKEINIQTNLTQYCRKCKNLLTLQKLKWQNKEITQVYLGTLKSITKHKLQDEQQQIHIQYKQLISTKQKYINSFVASNAVYELNKIIQQQKDKHNLTNSYHSQHQKIDQNVFQQRKRVTGLVQKKKQVDWSIPKIINDKKQKQDKMIETSFWEYQHIQQNMTIKKQAVIRTLSLERQKSQYYMSRLRKSKRIIQQQKEQIQNLRKQIQYLTSSKNKYQAIIYGYQKQIGQLNQKYLDLNKIFQKTKLQYITNKKQLIGQIINFDVLKTQFEQFKRRPRVNQQTQTQPKVILNKYNTQRPINKNIVNKSTIHRPKSTNINQDFQQTKVKTTQISNTKSYQIIYSPLASNQNTPKQSFFLEESQQILNKKQEQINTQTSNNFVNHQSQFKTFIMKQKKLLTNKTRIINFHRNKVTKAVSIQNNQNSLQKEAQNIKHVNYITFKSTQNSLTKAQKQSTISPFRNNSRQQTSRSKIVKNRTYNTSPFQQQKQINSHIKIEQTLNKNRIKQPKLFQKTENLVSIKFKQSTNKISNELKKQKQKYLNKTICGSNSLKKHKLKLNIKSFTQNTLSSKNINQTLRIIKQKQIINQVVIFLKQTGYVCVNQLSNKHKIKSIFNQNIDQCVFVIDYFIKLIHKMFEKNTEDTFQEQ